MKLHKKFITIALVVIFSMLAIAVPASPVHADEIDSLDPDEGRIGDTIDLDGSGFIPSNSFYICFSSVSLSTGYLMSEANYYEIVNTDVDSNSSGDISTDFDVPAELNDGTYNRDVTSGTYYVYVTLLDGTIEARENFTVIGAEISIAPDNGPPGTEATITGTGFDSNEDIDIEFDNDDVDIESGDNDTDNDGEFECTIIIPEYEAGDYTVTVTGKDSDLEAEDDFEVESGITLDPETGSPNSEIEITGVGFAADEDITVYFDDEEVDIESGDETVDDDGNFECTILVPSGTEPGDYDVDVEDDDGNSARAEFSVAIDLNVSPETGNVDTLITVSGSGFAASSSITVKYDDTQVATTTTDGDGDFTATFNAPVSVGGAHNITASDGTTSLSDVFTMESAAPTAPATLTPETDEEVNSKPILTWDGVTDPSGVTYSVQVSSDAAFATLLVDETGLTAMEYTLTDDQKLERSEEDAPYYWRVKAIDGASNESAWSTIDTFYVGGFSFPGAELDWPWPAIVGVCAAGFIPLGIFIGRRMAYQYY